METVDLCPLTSLSVKGSLRSATANWLKLSTCSLTATLITFCMLAPTSFLLGFTLYLMS